MENYNKNLFDRFLAGIAAVNVKTHDEYVEFMKLLEKETNLKWRLGQKPTQLDMFTSHREKTCIDRVVGRYMIRYSDISYYESKGYEIIEFSDLMKKENNMKFKVGDKVRVRSLESMKKEFGLDQYDNIDCSARFIHSMENCDNFIFDDDMLEPVKEPTNGEHFRKELKELKGIPVAVENGKPERCMGFCSTCLLHRSIPCQNELNKWCSEPYKGPEDVKPILDKVEHDYLASVIAPKRIYDNVRCIIKKEDFKDEYYILLKVGSSYIHLPRFKKEDHMYDGMELDRPYTLKKLGLEKEEKEYVVTDLYRYF